MISSGLIVFGQPALIISAVLFIAGAILSLLAYRNSRLASILGFGLGLLGCIFGVVAGVAPFIGASSGAIILANLGQLGTLSLGVDALSGLFVSIISIVGIAVSIYSFSYVDEYEEKGYNLGRFAFLYDIFLLSMVIVVTAQNALLFLIVWET